MAKTFFNDAVIGNSSMLGCLTRNGELVRLFWPNIDYPQHIDAFNAGIFFVGREDSPIRLDSESLPHEQRYIPDTNIVETLLRLPERGLKVIQHDYVLPGSDVLVRRYGIENTGNREAELGFLLYSSFISTVHEPSSVLFDSGCDALVHYRHGYYVSVSSDRKVSGFRLGDSETVTTGQGKPGGFDNMEMENNGTLFWKLGIFKPGEIKSFTLYICASDTLKGVRNLLRGIRESDGDGFDETAGYWRKWLGKARQIRTGMPEINELYKRSLLVFALMSDKNTGGLLAAPEVDEASTHCGRYAYCWLRDAAFITGALDGCGLGDISERFYGWAREVQDENGCWQQRYHMDGNLAPSWGLQIDETGTVVWGMLQHYKATGDLKFLERVWDSVKKAVEFMLNFIDPETGLPAPSYDIWEERAGEHAYSAAAVHAGIRSGAEISRILGLPHETALQWEKAAEGIKAAIVRNLWSDEKNHFIRSVRTRLRPWEREYQDQAAVIEVNSGECRGKITPEDFTLDASLLGVCIPFGVFDADDPRVKSTVEAIENALEVPGVGGIMRYQHDRYVGGNPWIITTLWLALYHVKIGNFGKAMEYLNWTVKSRTRLGLLPEQASVSDGSPAWVFPLTWSHAMYVQLLAGLRDAGVI